MGQQPERVLNLFSLNEVAQLNSIFKSKYKDQLARPTPATNELILFQQKFQSYVVTSHLFNTVVGGCLTYGVKRVFGTPIENVIFQKLSESRATLAVGAFYILFFLTITNQIDKIDRLNMNRFTQGKGQPGEQMLFIIQSQMPYKFNKEHLEKV